LISPVSTTWHISISCCQSRLLRAKRETSRAATAPGTPRSDYCRIRRHFLDLPDIRLIELVGAIAILASRAIDYHMADFKPEFMILSVLADMFSGEDILG
jgi:hypothetical protein